jgi:hypothetical protein
MPRISRQEMEAEIASTLTRVNHSIYKKKHTSSKFQKIPSSIYYYHISFDNNGVRTVRNYYYSAGKDKIHYDEVPQIVRFLALNARNDDYVPPSHGSDMGDVWRRKSYLVVLLDHPTMKLNAGGALVVKTDGAGFPNHTFFDAQDLDIDVSPSGNGRTLRSAICCKNHMKRNDAGDDLKKPSNGTVDSQEFEFRLYYSGRSRLVFDFYDSGGTNNGPPAPPPVPI